MPSAAGVHRDSTSAVDGISALLEHQRKAFLRDGPPSLRQRRTDLAKLKHAIQASANRIADVISDDFGSRSRHERLMAEVLSVCAAIRHASHHLPRWMRPKHVSVNLELRPGRARILYQPVGVVDHQPVELSISPCDDAAHLGTRSWQSGDAEAIGTNASDGTVYRPSPGRSIYARASSTSSFCRAPGKRESGNVFMLSGQIRREMGTTPGRIPHPGWRESCQTERRRGFIVARPSRHRRVGYPCRSSVTR